MHLQENEVVVKTFRHHPLIFFIRGLSIAVTSLPFFLVASFFQGMLSNVQFFLVNLSIASFFSLIIIYDLAIYYLDRLIFSNQRIIYMNWKNLFSVLETGVEFSEIQNIETDENGILNVIPLFNFGTLVIETAAKDVAINFKHINNPEWVKDFLYRLQTKPSNIENSTAPVNQTNQDHDSTHQNQKESETTFSTRENR